MKFGCCLNMIAQGADGTGIEHIEKLAQFGFDYVELPLAEMTALSEQEFLALKNRVERALISCETCNNFFPKTMRLTGPDVQMEEIFDYVKRSLARAASMGVQYVVFGSGAAKNVPEGFSLQQGYDQVVALLEQISPIAHAHQITIVIEPLRGSECNLINTFAEGCKLARDVNCENIKVLVDFYHLSEECEPVENIVQNGRYLRHVHFARNKSRSYPVNIDEDAYRPFFSALEQAGYDARISLEAYSNAFDCEAPVALRFLKDYYQQV